MTEYTEEDLTLFVSNPELVEKFKRDICVVSDVSTLKELVIYFYFWVHIFLCCLIFTNFYRYVHRQIVTILLYKQSLLINKSLLER